MLYQGNELQRSLVIANYTSQVTTTLHVCLGLTNGMPTPSRLIPANNVV